MHHHSHTLRHGEELVGDGAGGLQIVPAYLRSLTVAEREDCKEESCRVLLEEAMKMIPIGFSSWAKHHIEACIRAHDIRNNCAN